MSSRRICWPERNGGGSWLSYDIDFFYAVEGADPYDSYLASLEREDGENAPLTVSAENREAAMRLVRGNPNLECVEEASGSLTVQHRDFGNSNGIQLSFFASSAGLTVPYWHRGDAAVMMLQEVWEYMGLLKEQSGLLAYDPQIDVVVNLDEDFDEVLAAYRSGVEKTEEVKAAVKKPWWRFW